MSTTPTICLNIPQSIIFEVTKNPSHVKQRQFQDAIMKNLKIVYIADQRSYNRICGHGDCLYQCLRSYDKFLKIVQSSFNHISVSRHHHPPRQAPCTSLSIVPGAVWMLQVYEGLICCLCRRRCSLGLQNPVVEERFRTVY